MWYVIHTKPRKEDDVSRRFVRADLEVLNPKIKSHVSGLRPLFPNYIFLNYDLTKAENHHMIKYTRGVNRILGSRETPVPITDDVINIIRERLSPKAVLENRTLRIGSRVKVRRGLLQDLEGVLEKPVSADGRVAVLLKIHERCMKAVLHCKEVTLLS